MSDSSKRPRGGIQQRLQSSREEENKSSAVARYLLEQYAWGHMSAQQVQHIASLVLTDLGQLGSTVSFPDLITLAKLGTHGQHQNNVSRDMLKYVQTLPSMIPACEIPLPTAKGEEKIAFLLPHERFNYMYENNRNAFNALMVPDGQQSLQKFSSQCGGVRNLAGSSALEELRPSSAIPLACHGDEVPISGRGKCWCKLALVFSWYSLVAGYMPTKKGLLWIWASSPTHFCQGEHGTLNTFMRILAWSFNALYEGRWPHADHRGIKYAKGSKEWKRAGSWLAGGFYGIVVGLCGDLDYMAKFLQVPHWASSKPCGWCRRSRTGANTWKDSRENAPWRATVHTVSSWRASPDRSTNPIFSAKNISGLTTLFDFMHVKYLGYQQFLLGSCLWLLCYEILGGSPLQNIRAVGQFVRSYQRKHHVNAMFPLSSFQKLSIFVRQSGFPKLRGKGAHVRHVTKAIEALWKKKADLTNPNYRRIQLIFKLNRELEELLSDYSPDHGYYALPLHVATTVQNKYTQIAQLYQVLEEAYSGAEVPLFNVVAKLHYGHHILAESSNLHPHLSWCWRGEDMMNVTSVLLSSCLRGRGDAGASIKAMQKYRLAMYLSFQDLGRPGPSAS